MPIISGEGVWDQLPTKELSPDEVAESAHPLEAWETVPATGEEPKHPRGEDRACGNGVNCATIEIVLPAGTDVISVVRDAAEDDLSSGWHVNPQPGLGWCWWEEGGYKTLPNGRIRIFCTLKNWKHDKARRARLRAWTKAPVTD